MRIKDGIISSRKNPTVVECSSLSEKKYREKLGLFRTDGIKLARELFAHGIVPQRVLLKSSALDSLSELIESAPDCEALVLEDSVFDKVSEEKSPEGIICIVKHLDNFKKIATIDNNGIFCELIQNHTWMLAESLRDPGNLGTVIRSAAALGTKGLIISSDCADVYNPKTVRASMGALFGIDILITESLDGVIRLMRQNGRRVFAAALDRTAISLDELALKDGDCFVVGNEGHGLSQSVIDACDRSVFIPIEADSESLNAAAAAAILLWESRRQLGGK